MFCNHTKNRWSACATAWRWALGHQRDTASAAGDALVSPASEVANRRGARKTSATVMAARVVGVACLVVLARSTGLAGEVPAPKPTGFRWGVALLVASGVGSMSSDLNDHPGFGVAFQGYLPVASRFQLRPAFEWTGYRVNEYNLASRLLAEALGAYYEDTRVVFRTYRLGMDGVLYFRDRYRGPFLSGGIGVQVSQVYVEDVVRYGDGGEDVTPIATSSSTTGLWLGGGTGYQWESGSLELRLSRAPFRYTSRRPTEAGLNTLPFEPQPGWALHLIMGVTF